MKARNLIVFILSCIPAATCSFSLAVPSADIPTAPCPITDGAPNPNGWHRVLWHREVHQEGRTVPHSEEQLLGCIDECYKEFEFRECVLDCLEAFPRHR